MTTSAVEKSADQLRGYLSAARTGRKTGGSMKTKLQATAPMLAEYEERWAEERRARGELATERLARIARKEAEEAERCREAKGLPKKRSQQTTPQLGQPSWERRKKAPGGFDEENLAPNGAPEVLRASEATAVAVPSSGKRKSFLDKALQDAEVHALFRFVVGTMIGEGRMRLEIERTGDRNPVSANNQNRLPFNEAERLEIGARQFIYGRMPPESQRDIDIFTDQIMPRGGARDRAFYLSPVEFGKIITGSQDERVAKGGYIGCFKKLAHHVMHLYVEWEMIQFRHRQEAKASRNESLPAPAKLSTRLLTKVLAP
jgi:hypothetical protein